MKINLHIFIFIIIALVASINDIIIYTFALNYIGSILISIIIISIIIIILLKKKIVLIKSDFKKADLIFLIPFIIYGCILMTRCDYSWDVKNYHVYLQENLFTDKINFDFFPGRTINSFLFPLGDRMFYIFRYFLGYRLGACFSIYAMIILYYQVKNILKIMIPDITDKKLAIFSMCPTLLWSTNEVFGGYYIDNICCVVLLELIYFFIKQENLFEDKKNLYYIAILVGIATGIKVSNLIIAGIVVLAILFNNIIRLKKQIIEQIKKIKVRDILFLLILFLIPFIVYIIDNYIQTGSPLYPYYNKIFKSEYFGDLNWSDDCFGIPNLISSLVWPIMIIIDPLKGSNIRYVDNIWIVGYIASWVYVILKPKGNNKTYKLSCLSIVLSIIWAIFLMGYARYGIVIPVIYAVVLLNIITELDRKNIIQKIIFGLISLYLIVLCSLQFLYNINVAKLRLQLANNTIKDLKNNWEEYKGVEDIYEIDGVWGSINHNSAMITLVRNEKTPIYNLDSWHYMYCDKTKEMYYEKIKDKKIYTITEKSFFENTKGYIEREGYEIVGEPKIYRNYKYQDGGDFWYILELKYAK